MIALSLAACLPALLIGTIVVFLIFPGRVKRNIFLKLFLGGGAGFGISSCIYFCWLLVFGPTQKGYLVVEVVILIILFVLLIRKIKSNHEADNLMPLSRRSTWFSWILLGLFIVSLCAWGVSYRKYSFMFPHGTFDAYAIWNLRARMISRSGELWKVAFSPALNWKTHPDYPLLTSANIVRSWNILDGETTRVPILQSGLFTLFLVGLFFSAVRIIRSTGQASLGALLMLTTPWVLYFASAQNAEIPIAYYYLATCILLFLDVQTHRPGFLLLAGMMAGFAAWTKNEGLVFLLALVIILLIFNIRKPWAEIWHHYKSLFAGLLPMLLIIAYYKTQLAPPNDITANQTLTIMIDKILDPQRYGIILGYFGDIFLRLGEWDNPILVIVLLYMVIFWFVKQHQRQGLWMITSLLVLTLIGYFAIYLITPHPLEWHLKYSMDRLIFHLFPVYLLIIFLAARTPEEVFKWEKTS